MLQIIKLVIVSINWETGGFMEVLPYLSTILTFSVVLAVFLIVFLLITLIKSNQNEHGAIIRIVLDAVKPNFIKVDQESRLLFEFAVNVWKVKKRLEDFYKKNEISLDHRALDSGIDKLMEQINSLDIELIDFDGKKYNDGMNLEIISTIKENGVKDIIVKETMSPAILYRGQLVEKAKVTLLSGEE